MPDMKFSPVEIKTEYIKAFTELVRECEKAAIEIESIFAYMSGFRVTFKGVKGDAICHDGSYGRPDYWETYGMPWDKDDVTVHTARKLARLLSALLNGEDWESVQEEY